MECLMKLHCLHSHIINQFPKILEGYSQEQGQHFHQDKNNVIMMKNVGHWKEGRIKQKKLDKIKNLSV